MGTTYVLNRLYTCENIWRMEKTKIVVVDDHQIVVEGLVAMLQSTGRVDVCGTANNMRKAVSRLRETTPDVLLTDLNMPGKNGVELIKELREQFPFLKILVLTMYYDVRLMKELEQIDIDGFLLKNSTREDLIEATTIKTTMTAILIVI